MKKLLITATLLLLLSLKPLYAGEKALASGIKALLELGYLRMVKNYSVGHHGRKFQLSRPIEQTTDFRE